MDLNEYIKMSYERPNRKVLEGLGASEDLIEYLMETPGNTNWNVVDSITNSGDGSSAEVWLVGDSGTEYQGMKIFELSNVDSTDHMTELATNGENYSVFLDGVELPDYVKEGDDDNFAVGWFDDQSTPTKQINVYSYSGEEVSAQAVYTDALTAPTSVEVSVKAK